MRQSLARKVGVVSIVLGFAAVAELFNNIILGRVLPSETFGQFKFINTVIVMLSSLLLFGQHLAIIRLFSKASLDHYAWRRFLSFCLLISAIIAAIACLVIAYFYHLQREVIFVYVAVVSGVGIEYVSALLRSRERYSYSMFLSKNNSLCFFVAVAILFYFFKVFTLNRLLFVYTSIFMFTFVLGLFSVSKFPHGLENVPLRIVKEGFWLFLIYFSAIIMVQVDQFFIAKLMGYEKLADYVVIITVTRGFDLISMAIWFVLMPHYARNYSRSIRSDYLKVTVVALFVCVGYIVFGKWLLHSFFGGRFDHSAYLLNFFIAIGFFRVVYTIPSGIIGGRLPTKSLKFFLGICFAGVIINVTGNYLFIPQWGLTGAALAALFAWIFRVFTAFFIVRKHPLSPSGGMVEGIPYA